MAVFDRSVVYQRLPGATGAGPWVRLDLAGLLGGAGLGLFDGSKPGQTLQFLRGVGDLAQVGTDTVRGDWTRHYRATLDLAKAAEKLPADLRAGYLKLVQAQGSARRPTKLWTDDQSRLRRIRYATGSAAATTIVTQVLRLRRAGPGADPTRRPGPQHRLTRLRRSPPAGGRGWPR